MTWRPAGLKRSDEDAGGAETPEPLGERILVVDDEANMRTILRTRVERDGLAAVEAADGAEALERLHTAPYAAVLTDLRMPGLDGLQLLSRVSEEFPGLPVVLITAHGTVEAAIQAL